jgi:hypothetical protein
MKISFLDYIYIFEASRMIGKQQSILLTLLLTTWFFSNQGCQKMT